MQLYSSNLERKAARRNRCAKDRLYRESYPCRPKGGGAPELGPMLPMTRHCAPLAVQELPDALWMATSGESERRLSE